MTASPTRTRPPLVRLTAPDRPPWHPALPLPAAVLGPDGPPGRDPASERAAAAFYRVLAEVLDGRRPLAQVRPLLAPRAAALVADLIRGRPEGPLRAGRPRLQECRPGAVEANALLWTPRGCCAVAVRLERRRGGWVAVAVEAALPGDSRPRR